MTKIKYQRDKQKPSIEEGQTRQWPKNGHKDKNELQNTTQKDTD
jgi:hypothetical protein